MLASQAAPVRLLSGGTVAVTLVGSQTQTAGIVLVFTLLLWVNISVRAYLGALCWIGTND